MFELKPLSREGIPKALEKAERYRLLNEPWEAESICQDVLRIDEGNQRALVTLLLSITDQFGVSARVDEARALLPRLQNEYERAYYAGIICERRAKGLVDHGGPGTSYVAYDWLREAMNLYEKAIEIRPAGNEDGILRWNTCARIIMRHKLERGPAHNTEPPLE